jgi:hypothetical protein
MLYHIVRFTMRQDLPEDERHECLRRLRELETLDSTLTSTVCQDLGSRADGFTHSVVVTFQSEERFRRYQADLVHADCIRYVIPRWEKMMICDAADDMDPGLFDRLQSYQFESPAITPELIAYMEQIEA